MQVVLCSSCLVLFLASHLPQTAVTSTANISSDSWQDPQHFIKLLLQVNFWIPLTGAFFFFFSMRNHKETLNNSSFTCLYFKHVSQEKATRWKTFSYLDISYRMQYKHLAIEWALQFFCLLLGQLMCWRCLVAKVSSGTGQPFSPPQHAGLPYSRWSWLSVLLGSFCLFASLILISPACWLNL